MAHPEERLRMKMGPQTPQERIWWDRYSHANLQKWRSVCDDLADDCVRALPKQNPRALLKEIEARAKSEGGIFKDFIDHCYTVPSWVDFDAMEEGRRILVRYIPVQGLVLLCSSLVEGYAFSKPSQVLVQTGRLKKDVSRRIFETGQFLHNLVGADGLRPGGLGHQTLMEVRLLHASVRRFLDESGRYPEDLYQRPINQEDMAGTVLEFDFMVVRGMRRLGVILNAQERAAIHYFWRYAGYLLGVKEDLLSTTIEEQEVLALQLHSHGYSPTQYGAELAHALLKNMSQVPPLYVSESILHSFSRHLIGDELADEFQIKSTFVGKAIVGLVNPFLKGASVALKVSPEPVLKLWEHASHRLGKRTLEWGLGGDEADWRFKVQ